MRPHSTQSFPPSNRVYCLLLSPLSPFSPSPTYSLSSLSLSFLLMPEEGQSNCPKIRILKIFICCKSKSNTSNMPQLQQSNFHSKLSISNIDN